MKRCALYVRVSTAEQRTHGLSVDSQIHALKEYCSSNGYIVAGIYNDAGISASKRYTRRPELLRMINDCASGKVDLVIFTKLDRFFRNVSDYYECIAQMHNVPWSAIWEDYETETSAGKFKVNIMLSIAQAEAERTSERVKSVNDYRRVCGKYVGKAPTGYKMVNSQLVIDNETQEAVTEFFNVFETTGVIETAFQTIRKRGVDIRRSTARYMLTNEAYTGNANGYKCDAYITRAQFERNRELATSRIGTKCKKGRVYLFSGLMRCGYCGGRIGGCSQIKKGKVFLSYRCCNHYDLNTCPSTAIYFEKKLETLLLSVLEGELERYTFTSSSKTTGQDYEKERKALEAKLERIGARFEDGDITLEEYRAKRDKIKADIAAIPQDNRKVLPVLSDDWESVYNMLTKENKRSFWNGILKTIYLKKDNGEYKVAIEFL